MAAMIPDECDRDPIFGRYQREIAGFVAQPVVGQGFDGVDRLEIARVSDVFEQRGRQKSNLRRCDSLAASARALLEDCASAVLGLDSLAHRVTVGEIARSHPLDRRTVGEERRGIALAAPMRRRCGTAASGGP